MHLLYTLAPVSAVERDLWQLTFTQTIKWTDTKMCSQCQVKVKVYTCTLVLRWVKTNLDSELLKSTCQWMNYHCLSTLSKERKGNTTRPPCLVGESANKCPFCDTFLLLRIVLNDLAILQLTSLLASPGFIRPPQPSSRAATTSSATVVAFVVAV